MASSPALGFLLACANAIEDGGLKCADWLLHLIMNVAYKEPYKYQSRVVKFFAEALVYRAYGLYRPPSRTLFRGFEYYYYYYYYCCCYSCPYGSSNVSGIVRETIRNSLALMGKKWLHLIDISRQIRTDSKSVLSKLPISRDDPTSVRITLLSPFLKGDGILDYLKMRLHEKYKEMNIKVEDELKVVCASGLGVVDDFKTREDEATVVFYNLSLGYMLKDTGAMKRELVRLREINPALVFMVDFYANYDDFNFITYLEHSFQFYSNINADADVAADVAVDALSLSKRQASEGEDLNPIRRLKTLTEWKDVFLMGGFREVPLIDYKYESSEGEEDLEIMRRENECVVLGRKGFPILFLSAWKPQAENEHFNSNLSSSHPDFDSRLSVLLDTKIPPLQPLLPSPQGLLLNRLAAFIEILNIIEDLCGKYDISVALTWASRFNDSSENVSCPYKDHSLYAENGLDYWPVWDMSYPYKNHTLLIQSSYSYVEDEESYYFMKAYARAKHIKAGQSIAVKALESNEGFHFEPSIRSVCVGDNEFLAEALYYDIDAAAAICLQNCYTDNEVYVVEFFWGEGKPEDLAFDIINEFKSRKKKFVRVRVQDTGVGFQEKTISNILPPDEARDVDAVELNGAHDQEALELSGTKYRKRRSKVWADFDKFEVGGKEVAKCKHCSKEFSGSSKSGTTHLKNHLDRCPVKKIQNQGKELICLTDIDQEKSRLNLAKLIIKNPCLLEVADQKLFKNFVKGLQPMFEIQSKDAWLCNIHRIYREEQEKLKLCFDRLACKFHLTVNLWKDSRGEKAYCCLIAHFIDDEWELKRKFLSFKTLDCIYDAKAFAETIRTSVAEWNIGNKVCSITVDNSCLVQQIKESCLSDGDSLSSAHWLIPCNLIEDGLREIDDVLLKLRKSIEYVSGTTQGNQKFQEAVEKMKLRDRQPSGDVSFRLDSDFDILDSALGSKEIFCQLELIDNNFKLNPSMGEWEKAVALHSCLKCFDDVKGIKSPVEELYFPKLCKIYREFLQLEKRNHPIIRLMKRKWDHYWSLCNLALAVATVLDPRLKSVFVQFSYNKIYGHDNEPELKFRKVLRDVYREYANDTSNLTKSASNLDGSSSSTTETENACILDLFRKSTYVNGVASWKSELDRYLEEPLLPLDGASFDILDWWRVKSQTFPTLARMARDLLAMPVLVSAPCSNFGAKIMNPAYNSLNHESMEAFVCSQNWLETPTENDGKNHEPLPSKEKRKRKMHEDTTVVKVSKALNHEKANITRDIAKDSNKNECSPGKLNHARDTNGLFEILDDDTLFDNNLSDLFQSSSSDSDDETPLKQQGSWCKEDVRAYLTSDFTYKEYKRLDKWKKNEWNGKLIGRHEEFRLTGDKLAPLLLKPHGNESRKEYYINDSVVNGFFQLLKKRYDRFPKAYINHYSFDSVVATHLIEGTKTELGVLNWFKKDENLRDAQRLFLPLCISAHWVLFYVDTKEKKFSCLDSNPSQITSYGIEIHKILQWFKSFLLPVFGYSDANVWPFVVHSDLPLQENLVDCGIFVMKYGDCLTHGDFFPFTQEDIFHFRRRIFLDIYRGRLYNKR